MSNEPFPTPSNSIDQLLQSIESDYSIEKPHPSPKNIEQLVQEGYVGIDYQFVYTTALVVTARQFTQIRWVKTAPNEAGKVGLMTIDLEQFDQLLTALQAQFNQHPTVYRLDTDTVPLASTQEDSLPHPSSHHVPIPHAVQASSVPGVSATVPATVPVTVPATWAGSPHQDIANITKGYQLDGKYEVVDRLGEGGFGATFVVKSLIARIETYFAAKCQKLTGNVQRDQDLIERFEQEAIVLQQVGSQHGQIPTLFDYFDFEGNFYLIQELVRGQTLSDTVTHLSQKNQIFSEFRAAEIVVSLLEVLDHLHRQGLIHRDIKPENIILRQGDQKPVLIDFGLIKQLTQENYLQTGTIAGTIGYCPVEQQLGKALFQSDLYAVGMTFLFMTTGVLPHQLQFNDRLEADLGWAEQALPSHLIHWISKAIRPLPQDRFASAQEMRQALLDFLNQDYVVQGAQVADAAYRQQIASMQHELEQLRGILSQSSGFAPLLDQASSTQSIALNPAQVITTQKEIDAYNIIKRLIEQAGYDSQLLQLTDVVQHCDIHLRHRPDCVLVRLYFNDEDNLSFAIPLPSGKINPHFINTLRGIAPKRDQIVARMGHLLQRS